MEARVKATGKIVEIVSSRMQGLPGGKMLHYKVTKEGDQYLEESLDFNYKNNPDYWTRLEHQYAGMAMQGLMSILPQIGGLEGRSPKTEIIDIATDVAHALVEKMKNTNE